MIRSNKSHNNVEIWNSRRLLETPGLVRAAPFFTTNNQTNKFCITINSLLRNWNSYWFVYRIKWKQFNLFVLPGVIVGISFFASIFFNREATACFWVWNTVVLNQYYLFCRCLLPILKIQGYHRIWGPFEWPTTFATTFCYLVYSCMIFNPAFLHICASPNPPAALPGNIPASIFEFINIRTKSNMKSVLTAWPHIHFTLLNSWLKISQRLIYEVNITSFLLLKATHDRYFSHTFRTLSIPAQHRSHVALTSHPNDPSWIIS